MVPESQPVAEEWAAMASRTVDGVIVRVPVLAVVRLRVGPLGCSRL